MRWLDNQVGCFSFASSGQCKIPNVTSSYHALKKRQENFVANLHLIFFRRGVYLFHMNILKINMSKLIERCGGEKKFLDITGVHRTTVHRWKTDGTISGKALCKILQHYPELEFNIYLERRKNEHIRTRHKSLQRRTPSP
jgi:hypothetical protein